MLHTGELALAGAFIAAHLLGLAAVEMGTKGRHLNDLMLAPAAIDHVNDAKTPADDKSTAKQGFDLLRRGVGGHIKILGPQADQQVTHRATHDESLITGVLERAHNVHGAVVHQ